MAEAVTTVAAVAETADPDIKKPGNFFIFTQNAFPGHSHQVCQDVADLFED